MKKTWTLFPGLLGIFACGDRIADPGNGSETTNGLTAIVLNTENVIQPNALVYVRPKEYLADTNAASAKGPTTRTDANGYFFLDSVPEGSVIEILAGNKEALKFSYSALHRSGMDTLKLQKSTALYGQIDAQNLVLGTKVYIQIKGLERIAIADSTGNFSFSALPPGNHEIRILSNQKDYGVTSDSLQTQNGENRNGGTFLLPFDYWRDSSSVQALLDSNGLKIPVNSVTERNREGRIVGLKLDNLGIKKLPNQMKTLRLKHLSLNDNLLDSLSDVVGQISTLEVLTIRRNALRFIPGNLGDIPYLRELDLSENQLSSLPESLTRLSRLSTLSVAQNYLSNSKAPVSTWLDIYCTDTPGGDWRTSQK